MRKPESNETTYNWHWIGFATYMQNDFCNIRMHNNSGPCLNLFTGQQFKQLVPSWRPSKKLQMLRRLHEVSFYMKPFFYSGLSSTSLITITTLLELLNKSIP